ncbi:MAG: hypothetical protein H6828_00765 [Planctomycetes bacterium]|nr:hypothetical protein [Planctomycetota bacterium]
MDGLLLILPVLGVVVAVRVALHHADKERIRIAATSRGWSSVEVSWAPFAPGWFFEKGERHYRVDFVDEHGRRGEVYCKTGMLTGVYWREPEAWEGSHARASAPAPATPASSVECAFCRRPVDLDAPDALQVTISRPFDGTTQPLHAHQACLTEHLPEGVPPAPPRG